MYWFSNTNSNSSINQPSGAIRCHQVPFLHAFNNEHIPLFIPGTFLSKSPWLILSASRKAHARCSTSPASPQCGRYSNVFSPYIKVRITDIIYVSQASDHWCRITPPINEHKGNRMLVMCTKNARYGISPQCPLRVLWYTMLCYVMLWGMVLKERYTTATRKARDAAVTLDILSKLRLLMFCAT